MLAPGDVLKFSYPGATEYNQTQKIRPDGKVSLPIVGEIVASGKSLGALQDELASRYKKELKVSEVVISLESTAATVSVTGAVVNPGRVPLFRPMTVLDAIEESGGTSNVANRSKIVVVRTVNNRHYTQTFDLKAAERGEAPAFYLKPYDRVIVPERFF